jgi:hypothetical protein
MSVFLQPQAWRKCASGNLKGTARHGWGRNCQMLLKGEATPHLNLASTLLLDSQQLQET